MTILDLKHTHTQFGKDVLPFLSQGVFIDTSVLKIFIDGFIDSRFSEKQDRDFENLLNILNYLKWNNQWNKFWITPHVLTEICNHFNKSYNKRQDFKQILKEIIPIFNDIKEEKDITKDKILTYVDLNKPVIELGDISLFVCIDSLIKNCKKTAVLVKDEGFNRRYENDPNTMVIDFDRTYLSLI